ncbi:MAG TPA: paraquat-inducible protein A [Xanthobacteraceae bacterium]
MDLGRVLCRNCGLSSEWVGNLGHSPGLVRCARCQRPLIRRIPQSTEKTWAWLIAALILYVPANVLPVMHTSGLLGAQDSTILGGIEAFARSGSWDIALLIFTASVLVPVTKFLALGLLLWSVRTGTHWARRERAKLYRIVEFIGYWSMLDVVVVALTASLIQFKALGSAEPRLGIAFFCAVVMLTMIAARSFDPRLLWDRG